MVALTDAKDSGFDPVTRIEARLLFGDVLMRLSHEREAAAAYKEAWQIARQFDIEPSQSDSRLAIAEELTRQSAKPTK